MMNKKIYNLLFSFLLCLSPTATKATSTYIKQCLVTMMPAFCALTFKPNQEQIKFILDGNGQMNSVINHIVKKTDVVLHIDMLRIIRRYIVPIGFDYDKEIGYYNINTGYLTGPSNLNADGIYQNTDGPFGKIFLFSFWPQNKLNSNENTLVPNQNTGYFNQKGHYIHNGKNIGCFAPNGYDKGGVDKYGTVLETGTPTGPLGDRSNATYSLHALQSIFYSHPFRFHAFTYAQVKVIERLIKNPFLDINGFTEYDNSFVFQMLREPDFINEEVIKMFLNHLHMDIRIGKRFSNYQIDLLIDAFARDCNEVLKLGIKGRIRYYIPYMPCSKEGNCVRTIINMKEKNKIKSIFFLLKYNNDEQSQYIFDEMKKAKNPPFINSKDREGRSLLHLICHDHDFDHAILHKLIIEFSSKKAKKRGWSIDMNAKNKYGFTPVDRIVFEYFETLRKYAQILEENKARWLKRLYNFMQKLQIVYHYGGRANKEKEDFQKMFTYLQIYKEQLTKNSQTKKSLKKN